MRQALMSWAVANDRVEPTGNAIIITKQASGSAKIDPLMAAFNAVALMSTNPWFYATGHLCDLIGNGKHVCGPQSMAARDTDLPTPISPDVSRTHNV